MDLPRLLEALGEFDDVLLLPLAPLRLLAFDLRNGAAAVAATGEPVVAFMLFSIRASAWRSISSSASWLA